MVASLLLCLACRQPATFSPNHSVAKGLTSDSQVAVALKVDVSKVVGTISPYIYGSNENDWDKSGRYLTFGRQGGNRMTAYNWENNASNAGSDFQNQSDDYLGGGTTPGEVPRKEVDRALAHGATFLVTLPMAGYVAGDKNAGGDVNLSPNYLTTRFKKSVAKKGSAFTYPPNLNDDSVYQDEFVSWLEKLYPHRKPGADIWYSLDNEPDIWSSTHSRIHPNKATYAEIIEKSVALSKAVKAIAPKALIFGPASYGWEGYVRFQDPADANNRDFLEYYLTQMKESGLDTGKRLLDVLDLHWYPEAQGDGKRIVESATTPGIVKARMQATRSLWDPTYVEDSWITKSSTGGKAIQLIPRVMEKIQKCYPGTKLAFTEYQFGAPNHISGAIAQADALGIFGRYGVFAASLWPYGGDVSFVHAAFDAFRNYDGIGAQFGDLALSASTSAADKVSIYASKSSKTPGKFVFVILNKQENDQICILSTPGVKTGSTRQYSLTSDRGAMAINHFANPSSSGFALMLPKLSVNVLEITG